MQPGLQRAHAHHAPGSCAACPIRELAVCAYCDPQELGRLNAIKSYRDFAPGRDVASAGAEMAVIGSVVRGVVKLTKSLPDGRAQMVGLLFPGDFVGRPGQTVAEFDATAATDVTLCLFQRQPFEAVLRESPSLEQRLLDMTLSSLDAARGWLLLLGRKTARERVASFLLGLADRGGAAADAEVTLPLSRGETAEYLGLTIETVSRHMTRLRADGLIAFDNARAFRVADRVALATAAGD